ncbi:MAG TPA: hypothetical protein VGS08_06095, partial [Candidatus Saccharimonadales bacterium]|nr:hypothetical protein [Candidatus Saccharimonadales bacterium]
MSYNPQNPNGQATMANSSPVVIASDQSAVKVDGSAVTQPVSGTVTANAGSGTFNIQANASMDLSQVGGSSVATGGASGLLAIAGNVASESSDSGNPVKVGAVFNSSAPTPSSGQRVDLQADSSGNLKTNVTNTVTVSGTVTANAGSGTQSTNIAQVNGATVATAATGIAKVGLTDGSGAAITSTSSALDVNIKSGGSASAATTDEASWTAGSSSFAPTGGVFNDSAAALTSGQQGTARLTNNRAIHTNLRNASGTEIATSSNPVRIDPTGTTTQPISGTVTANAGTNLNTSALALESGGNLATTATNTTGLNNTVGTAGSAIPSKGLIVQGSDGTNARALKTDTSGNLAVNIQNTPTFTANNSTASNLKAQVAQLASVSSSATLQSAVSATGNGSTLSTDGMSSVVFTVSGTFTATVFFEGTEDGSNYTSLNVSQLGTNSIVTSTTSTGVFQAECAGLQNVRGRVTWTSGTSVTVTAHTVPVTFAGKIHNSNEVSDSAHTMNKGASDATTMRVTLGDGAQSVGTVTANAGTNLNTSALALDTSVNGVLVSQGSTTSGQKGPLTQGAVTT